MGISEEKLDNTNSQRKVFILIKSFLHIVNSHKSLFISRFSITVDFGNSGSYAQEKEVPGSHLLGENNGYSYLQKIKK